MKKRKPRSRTRPTVDGREPGAGWWCQLIHNVPEMSHGEKTAKRQKMDEKSITLDHSRIGHRKDIRDSKDFLPLLAFPPFFLLPTSFLLPVLGLESELWYKLRVTSASITLA